MITEVLASLHNLTLLYMKGSNLAIEELTLRLLSLSYDGLCKSRELLGNQKWSISYNF